MNGIVTRDKLPLVLYLVIISKKAVHNNNNNPINVARFAIRFGGLILLIKSHQQSTDIELQHFLDALDNRE